MLSQERIQNYALWGAKINGDLEAVRQLLAKGADPDFLMKFEYKYRDNSIIKSNHVEMVKILLDYVDEVDSDLLLYIQNFSTLEQTKELLFHIIESNKKLESIQKFFILLLTSKEFPKTLELKFLNLLLDHGLPVNDFIEESDREDEDSWTPMHLAIELSKINFVEVLLKRGADVNKKTLKGETSLLLAVINDDYDMVELLLKNGAEVDETVQDGETALGYACRDGLEDIILLLLANKADINLVYDDGQTPLTKAEDEDILKILMKELAMLKFQNLPICDRNLEDIQEYEHLTQNFENCLKELNRMRNLEIFNNCTLYDILNLRYQHKKLVRLTRNENFVTAFKSSWSWQSFEFYGEDLKDLFENAVNKKNIIESEKKKIYESGLDKKFSLPPEMMEIIVEYATEHLYFE